MNELVARMSWCVPTQPNSLFNGLETAMLPIGDQRGATMATAAATGAWAPLENSKALRFATVFLFYFTQGVPIGLFFYAIPAYMAASGASTGEIATVVGISNLPWTLKLVNGFIMDRYAYLPMGRRRAWVLGAQCVMTTGMLIGAAISPGGSDVALLAGLGFVIMAATTFQDVAIDSMVIDIMPSDEQARVGGVMFGAQVLGMAAATSACGYLVDFVGIAAAYLAGAAAVGAVMLYGIAVRERAGERRLPWSRGQAHSRNLHIQITAWPPLLKQSFRAMVVPLSLLLVPFLLIRAMPAGAFESYLPTMTAEFAGWRASDYTNVVATAQLAAALIGLTVGGWAIARAGAQRALIVALAVVAAMAGAMGLATSLWSDSNVLVGLIWTNEIVAILVNIALIPLAMRLCRPEVAATQFTIYMGLANFGRPLGAMLAGATAGVGSPVMLFAALAAIFAVAALAMVFIRFPSGAAIPAVVGQVPHGDALAPEQD